MWIAFCHMHFSMLDYAFFSIEFLLDKGTKKVKWLPVQEITGHLFGLHMRRDVQGFCLLGHNLNFFNFGFIGPFFSVFFIVWGMTYAWYLYVTCIYMFIINHRGPISKSEGPHIVTLMPYTKKKIGWTWL